MPRLEQLIKQAKFKSEKHKALLSIIYASNMINNYLVRFFKKHRLTMQQYNALRILRGQYPKPCTLGLIQERMFDKMSDTSRIVERLRKVGLLERLASKKDKRAVDVLITRKGLNLLSQIDRFDAEMNRPTNQLSEIDARKVNELMEKVFASMVD